MSRKITSSFLLILFFVFSLKNSNAQNLSTEIAPKWRLGINGGGTWQTSDVKSRAGLAGGFNLERILNKRDDAAIGFSLGFRYLSGWTYGEDDRKNTGLLNNSALNGHFDTTLNYSQNPGYFYNNYRSKLADGSLELKLNFPAMEKRTRLIFHVFGGLGITKFKTMIDAKDNNGKMYNFSSYTNGPALSDLRTIYGNSYETMAQGSNSNGVFVFAPAVGAGIGFRIGKNTALVVEHRVAFTFTDDLDGQRWNNYNKATGTNDIYHYTSVGLRFTLRGHSNSTSTSTSTTTNTNNSTNTNTTTNTTTNTNTQNNPNIFSTVPGDPKPLIHIYNPGSSPHNTTIGTASISGAVQYVNSASNISITQNSYAVNNFNFNPTNGALNFSTVLAPGANHFTITASNNAGQVSKNITIHYTPAQDPNSNTNNPAVYPPKVNIVYPLNNYTTTTANLNVSATISNVSNSNGISVTANGYNISNYSFNSITGAVSFPMILNPGNNVVTISAFNSAGNDAQTVNVIYRDNNANTSGNNNTNPNTNTTVPEKPLVTYFNPGTSPFQVYTATFGVTAQVSNVTTANQITVNVNGNTISNFTFNANGYVNFSMNLNEGANSVIITGTNNAGSDTKSVVLDYKINGFAPVVQITNPTANPYTTTISSITVDASVKNITSSNQIKVLANNVPVNFNFNAAAGTISIPLNLSAAATALTISATNNFGSDIKSASINLAAPDPKPLVTILSPNGNPYNTQTNNVTVTAQVLYVSNQNYISVTKNGQAVPFTYNGSTHVLSFTPNLSSGYNTYTVQGSTKAGSDSKNVTINLYRTSGSFQTTPIGNTTIVTPPLGDTTKTGPVVNTGTGHGGHGSNTTGTGTNTNTGGIFNNSVINGGNPGHNTNTGGTGNNTINTGGNFNNSGNNTGHGSNTTNPVDTSKTNPNAPNTGGHGSNNNTGGNNNSGHNTSTPKTISGNTISMPGGNNTSTPKQTTSPVNNTTAPNIGRPKAPADGGQNNTNETTAPRTIKPR